MINSNNSESILISEKVSHYRGWENEPVCSACGRSDANDIFAPGIVRGARSGRQRRPMCPALPLAIHQDDIVRGRLDLAAARRREEAERKRLIAANQKPHRPAPKCDHDRPVRTHTFSDGNVLKLYRCGCSNGAEILNGRKTYGR